MSRFTNNGKNYLYYGDNLDNLRRFVPDESVDLCYIDPPFNSKRNYNQIYNRIGKEDIAQAQAFIDTWTWDDLARKGFSDIVQNSNGLFTNQAINLIIGLEKVLGQDSLLAYLVSMTLRVAEIHRVLKPTGNFYFHCDPTSSHYLKLILDSIFCSQSGDFKNEIIWNYSGWNSKLKDSFSKRHDVIFFYSKGKTQTFNSYSLPYESKEQYVSRRKQKIFRDETGREYVLSDRGGGQRIKRYLDEAMAYGQPIDDVWKIDKLNNSSKERLGYPTQKPEALLERIIKASTNEGDVVLDAYCGCGTSVAVAQKLNRRWIGIDITYQAISVILKRLEDTYNNQVLEDVVLSGIPRDLSSAEALANREDDRTRKEFEKWAVLTYSKNRAAINQKKGADQGVDGRAFFPITDKEFGSIIFQVKSGKVDARDIRDLVGTMSREKADLGVFITLRSPTQPMIKEAKSAEFYHYQFFDRDIPKIQIVTVEEIINGNAQFNVPLVAGVLKSAPRNNDDGGEQLELVAG
ncbi:MAG: restriction endonuclease [Plectolyngbya sp. WJT66-NPBG17]|jgi:site-specific DNA-methyltransferase (adenine-specific)|nr:restriction endonuclease [Plectolyngbya sp. WJT66-NPBG17]